MLGIAWSMIATKWFVCLFAEVLPIEVRLAADGSPIVGGDGCLMDVTWLGIINVHMTKERGCCNW